MQTALQVQIPATQENAASRQENAMPSKKQTVQSVNLHLAQDFYLIQQIPARQDNALSKAQQIAALRQMSAILLYVTQHRAAQKAQRQEQIAAYAHHAIQQESALLIQPRVQQTAHQPPAQTAAIKTVNPILLIMLTMSKMNEIGRAHV